MQRYTTNHFMIASTKEASYCINLSKTSWPEWWKNNEKFGKKHIINCIQNKRCLLVKRENKIIAFVVRGILWNKVHIQDIFVKENYRKMGIATQLLQKIIKIAKKQGFKEIVSDTDISNSGSIKFHLKCGFKKCGIIKNNWDNEDSIVFSIKI